LIGLPQFVTDPVMAADHPESPTPLAEISQGPSAFEQFLDNNQKNLVIFAVLVAIGAAAVVVYRGVEKGRQESAGAGLSKATDLAAYQSVVQDHAGTQAASSAMILLAERQWEEGQQDIAIATLRDFIAANASHPAYPSARASLGSKLMAQGKAAEATTVFQEIADDPKARFIAPYALISLGDIAKVAGDLEKAEASYSRVKKDFPESSFADTANRRIAILRAKPPVEVEPLPAPATEEAALAPAPATQAAAPDAPTSASVTEEASPEAEPAPEEETPAAPQ
jgi:predicted negative regulator of RcsB-dependent stress response